ncbi:MAG: ABC transporter permease [Acidimicrobiales bacterium]|nr:ABC transporter permease [Acidimicrobiales bacterium]
MPTALLIAAKDLRQRARDKSLFILAFIAPLALGFIFSIILGGADPSDERITFDYGVVDLDGGDLATGFSDLLAELEENGLVEVTSFSDTAAAREAVDDTDVSAAFVLPAGLSDALATGTDAQIRVIGSVDASIATDVAGSIARAFTTRVSTSGLAGVTAAMSGAVSADDIATVASQVAMSAPLAQVEVIERDTDSLDFGTTMVAGMAIFFAFFVAGTAVTGILEERESGTLPRLLISPASRAAILFGKASATIIVGIVALIALVSASTLIMGADWGPAAGVLPLIVAGVLAATGIMSLVGGLARNAEQAGNLQAIVAISMAMLGGAFGLAAPEQDSLWGRLALLTPVRWFLRGLEELAAGGPADVVPATVALLVMAVVTGSAALAFAGKVLRP